MARKFPKDARRLIDFICKNGGNKRFESGEVIVEHPLLWRVRTSVHQRRKDSSRDLYRLAKAVAKLIDRRMNL